MLLQLNKIIQLSLVVAIFFALSSCGFRPVYKSSGGDNPGISNLLSSITVKKVGFGRPGQVFQTHLENLLNPKGESLPSKYSLSVEISRRKTPFAIEQDREITRYNLIVNGRYVLVNSSTGKVVTKNKSKITASYDTADSDFATFVSEEDTLNRIMKEMAEDIHFRISSLFLNKAKD